MANPTIIFPFFIWILSTWRVSRLRHFSYSDYQDRVNESVADTVKEKICHTFPFFLQAGIRLPAGHTTLNVINIILGPNNEANLQLLSYIYNSFQQFGINSPFFAQAIHIALTIMGGVWLVKYQL